MRFGISAMVALSFMLVATAPGTASTPLVSAVAAEGVGVLSSDDGFCPPHTVDLTFVSEDGSSGTLTVAGAPWNCSGHVVYELDDCGRQGTALVCDTVRAGVPSVFVPILDGSFVMEDSGRLSLEASWLADNGVAYHTSTVEGHVVPVYALAA